MDKTKDSKRRSTRGHQVEGTTLTVGSLGDARYALEAAAACLEEVVAILPKGTVLKRVTEAGRYIAAPRALLEELRLG
jgi:hypothetical protein